MPAMPRNIEIKARLPQGVQPLLQRAQALAGRPAHCIEQHDRFYAVPQGRLKLRQADGRAELIQYQRADDTAARASQYLLVPLPDLATAQALHAALAAALGERGSVRKRRWLLLHEEDGLHTRIHLDEVEGLGSFIELEVVLQPGQTDAEGQVRAEALMQALGLQQAERVAGAYLDVAGARASS